MSSEDENESSAAVAAAPVERSQRFEVLDALRGFSLFGICFANLTVFSAWVATPPPVKQTIPAAQYFDVFQLMLIDGRFYTIFSFLFGLGFALQLSRLEQSVGASVGARRYVRRLAILLMIGLAHMFVLWHGDILVLYALMGFVLFLLRGLSDRAVLLAAALALLVPLIGYLLFWKLGLDPDAGFYEAASVALGGDGSLPFFFQGFILHRDTADLAVFSETLVALSNFRIGYLIETWRVPKVLGVMLIGLWAGRQLVKGTLLENVQLQKRVLMVGLVIGVPASVWQLTLGGLNVFSGHSINGLLSMIAYSLAVFPMGFAYAAAFALLWRRGPGALALLAAPGRMALTNYLSQTVISIAIFYGIGFGLGAAGAPYTLFLLALVIVLLQIWLSALWLSRYQFGPAEWAWRCLTYGALLPIRRAAPA